MFITSAILVGGAVYVYRKVQMYRAHREAMVANYEHRIHVNGIRGKSSVTRLIAASLRQGKIKTLAKTTGTAARLITGHKTEAPVPRKEANVAEQKQIIDAHLQQGHQALVFECMAINPAYQEYLEHKIMHSTIGVITNVREDHTDALGKTLPEIARSLSATVPKNGHLVTAETDPVLLDILAEVCKERGSKLHAVGKMRISNANMAKFKHFEFKENVAIAIKVAELVGVDRKTALAGMYKAMPDPGAFVLKKVTRKKRTIHWANLFAINDRESFIITTAALRAKVSKKAKQAVILNNRHDRPERVAQFVDVAVNAVGADYIFTFGDYEKQVQREVKKYRDKKVKVITMGNSTELKTANGKVLFNKMVDALDDDECLLYGAVNIHTPQSVALLARLEKKSMYAHS